MYDIHQHKHSYAIWTASRAWNRKLKGGDLALAQRLIGVAGLESVRGPDDIGENVDAWLLERMRLIVEYAAQHQILGINYGRAQKLVNIYLKTKLVCGGQEAHRRWPSCIRRSTGTCSQAFTPSSASRKRLMPRSLSLQRRKRARPGRTSSCRTTWRTSKRSSFSWPASHFGWSSNTGGRRGARRADIPLSADLESWPHFTAPPSKYIERPIALREHLRPPPPTSSLPLPWLDFESVFS